MHVITVTKENFYTEVSTSEIPVLLDFWASWCAPCKMLSPLVDEIAAEHPEIRVGKVNVDEQSDLATQFGIMSIPTLVLVKNGKLAARLVGAHPKSKIEEMIR